MLSIHRHIIYIYICFNPAPSVGSLEEDDDDDGITWIFYVAAFCAVIAVVLLVIVLILLLKHVQIRRREMDKSELLFLHCNVY